MLAIDPARIAALRRTKSYAQHEAGCDCPIPLTLCSGYGKMEVSKVSAHFCFYKSIYLYSDPWVFAMGANLRQVAPREYPGICVYGDKMSKLIPLTRGFFATVDDEDYGFLMHWKWYAAKRGYRWYAVRGQYEKGWQTIIYMHRVITGVFGKIKVDHRDRNGLNNTRANLRTATDTENTINRAFSPAKNTSGFKGVHFNKSANRWVAQLQHKHLGCFATPEEAARAYDEAAVKCHGEFAWTNFKDDTPFS